MTSDHSAQPTPQADATHEPVEDGGSMMQALLRLNIVEPIVQVEMPEQMPQLEFIPTIPLPQEITLNATANFNTLEVAKIGYRVNGGNTANLPVGGDQ